MSPNAPLYTPSASGSIQMSIDYTIQGYLEAGVPASKIMVGIPFYGHTWYKPGMSSPATFGQSGEVQGQCCGPFKSTYGGKPGKGCSQCGVMMYSEILAAGCDSTFDDETQSDIAYCSSAGKDGGYTEAGTWITYNSKKSIEAITKYSMDKELAGVFVFDTSMDTAKFELMNGIADQLAGASPSPTPSPTPTPPAPSPAPTPSGGKFRCSNNQCVSSTEGVSESDCKAICGEQKFRCENNQCVADASGVSEATCNA